MCPEPSVVWTGVKSSPVPPRLACSGGLRSVKNTVLKIGIEALGSGRHGRIPGAGTHEFHFSPLLTGL